MFDKNKMMKLTGGLALAGALLVGTAACSNNDDNSSTRSSKVSKSKKATKKAVKQNETKLKKTKIDVSQTTALNKFNDRYPDKKIKSIDLKLENNAYVYEIDGFDNKKEYSATIDADNGKILHSKFEKLDLDDHLQKALDLDKAISRDEASKIAEKHADGVSNEWSLEQDDDHNTAYWGVKVNNGTKSTEVKIDAYNKKVVSTENDD